MLANTISRIAGRMETHAARQLVRRFANRAGRTLRPRAGLRHFGVKRRILPIRSFIAPFARGASAQAR